MGFRVLKGRLGGGLGGGSADLIGRISPGRVGQFVVCCLDQVDVEDVREAPEVDHDVADLCSDLVPGGALHDSGRLLGGEPLHFGEELTHLAGQCHGPVFRGVELLPVALQSEDYWVLIGR
jgi:hypothetical protein